MLFLFLLLFLLPLLIGRGASLFGRLWKNLFLREASGGRPRELASLPGEHLAPQVDVDDLRLLL
eukprot:1189402-Pyramimonas_sp.AAC.1